MDRFFAGVDSGRKRRFHFHAFFAELHAGVHALGSVERAVEVLLGDADLVCFDEFHVNDIGDGMFVARLLDILFAERRTLVVTSNQPPHGLLPNPLFHDRFVPTIDRIRVHLDVVALDGPLDYRTRTTRRDHGFVTGHYLVEPTGSPTVRSTRGGPNARPANPQAPRSDPGPCLGGLRTVASPGPSQVVVHLAHGRAVEARSVDGDAITFDFEKLCGTPTSAADYLHLTRRFRRWTLTAVPPLREVPPDWAMRLVNLVDVLYDADLPCAVHAAEPVAMLVAGVPSVPDLARTASRLCELSQRRDVECSHCSAGRAG